MGSSTQSSSQVYDEVRSTWVAATPEEMVRQSLLKKMIHELSYPRELIAVEKKLSELAVTSPYLLPTRRIDIACFARGIHPERDLYPLLLVECKADSKDLPSALEQVKGYNRHIQACFIGVASPEGELFGFLEKGVFRSLSYLPPYPQLIQALNYGH